MTDFDWVDARADCSVTNVFVRLKADTGEDVDAENRFFRGTGRKFALVPGPTSFIVHQDIVPPRSITFLLSEEKISASDERGREQLSATVTLNKDKQCRLLVNGEEMEEWQFRKKALERLFFSGGKIAVDPSVKFGG